MHTIIQRNGTTLNLKGCMVMLFRQSYLSSFHSGYALEILKCIILEIFHLISTLILY